MNSTSLEPIHSYRWNLNHRVTIFHNRIHFTLNTEIKKETAAELPFDTEDVGKN